MGALSRSFTVFVGNSFQDISEKMEVIDASYPWYGDAVVYKKNPGLYFPVFRTNTSHNTQIKCLLKA